MLCHHHQLLQFPSFIDRLEGIAVLLMNIELWRDRSLKEKSTNTTIITGKMHFFSTSIGLTLNTAIILRCIK